MKKLIIISVIAILLCFGTVMAAPVDTYNVETAVQLQKLEAEGYNFLGWGYYAEGKFYQLEGLTIAAGNFGNITLHAVWETVVTE